MRNTFCLESVQSFNQINASPMNRSKSKNLWSFAKDSRFKKPVVYCDNIYERDSSFRKKGTAIGYGTKSDFTKDLTASPGSSKYKLKTIFDKSKSTKRGYTMNLSRQKLPAQGYIPLDPIRVPGPNRYNNLKLDQGSKYSLRKKTIVFDKTMTIENQNNNPGAGTYEDPEALSPRGKYTVSKHKGTGATLINPKRSVRFFQFKKQVPGPGKYEEVRKLSNQGKYLSSKSAGFGKRYFDKESRMVDFEQKAVKNYNPGPGSYRSPSDFGQYDGDIYNYNLNMYQTSLSKSGNSFSKVNRTARSSRKRF